MDKKRILVIDDEKEFCELVSTHLKTKDTFEPFFALNGREGINTAKEVKPDLVLLDIMMPQMNGFEVLSALKRDEATSRIPVIMLTVVDNDIARKKATGQQAGEYVTKPVIFSELDSKIEKALK